MVFSFPLNWQGIVSHGANWQFQPSSSLPVSGGLGAPLGCLAKSWGVAPFTCWMGLDHTKREVRISEAQVRSKSGSNWYQEASCPHPQRKDSSVSGLLQIPATRNLGPFPQEVFPSSHLVQEAQVIFSMTKASVTCFPRGTSCTWRL